MRCDMDFDVEFEATDFELPVEFEAIQEVTDGGYDKGYAEGHKKGYTEGETKGEAEGYERGLEQGYENGFAVGGMDSQWWLDWFKTRTDISEYFNNETGITRLPKGIDFSNATNAQYLFYTNKSLDELPYLNTINVTLGSAILDGVQLKKTTVTMAIHSLVTAGWAFARNNLKRINFIGNGSLLKTGYDMFTQSTIEEIHCYSDETMTKEVPLDLSNQTESRMFTGAPQLKYVRFEKECINITMTFNSSNLLADETVQSIIDGLADLTGQTMQSLDFHSAIVTKLTDEQVMQIISKNWEVK